MQAVYLEEPLHIGMRDVEDAVCGEGQVLIRVVSAGICGSDVSAYRGLSPICTFPRILGHEVGGVVIEARGGDFLPGERVVLEPYIYCGSCYPCSIGRTNCCESLQVLGVHVHGAMSDTFAHPAHLVHRVGAAISDTHMAMVEPVSIALHAVHRLGVQKGEHVAVFGAGQIGNLVAQVAMAYGGIPIVIDVLESRLDLAKKVGVPHVVNAREQDVVEAVLAVTNGRGAECVAEASGAEACVRQTIDVASFAGRVALVGHPKHEVSMPTALFTRKELDVRGSRNSVREFPESIALVAESKVQVEPLISAVVRGDELADYVVKQAEHPSDYIKIIGRFA